MAISDQMRMLKATSSKWINDNKLVRGRLSWQEVYGAFSYARSQRDSVIQHIMTREGHHKRQTFREEYLNLLKKFEIAYDDRYIFEFHE